MTCGENPSENHEIQSRKNCVDWSSPSQLYIPKRHNLTAILKVLAHPPPNKNVKKGHQKGPIRKNPRLHPSALPGGGTNGGVLNHHAAHGGDTQLLGRQGVDGLGASHPLKIGKPLTSLSNIIPSQGKFSQLLKIISSQNPESRSAYVLDFFGSNLLFFEFSYPPNPLFASHSPHSQTEKPGQASWPRPRPRQRSASSPRSLATWSPPPPARRPASWDA